MTQPVGNKSDVISDRGGVGPGHCVLSRTNHEFRCNEDVFVHGKMVPHVLDVAAGNVRRCNRVYLRNQEG